MSGAFVIRPFNTKKDSKGSEIDFEKVHAELIEPALVRAGYAGKITTGDIIDSGNIREDMFQMIIESDIVVCDITIHNANVFYELGIRHGLRKKSTFMIRGEPTGDDAPFDIATDRYFPYPWDKPGDALDDLIERLKATLVSDRETDSPVFALLPDLQEANHDDISVVPLSFHEEVNRAQTSKRHGWLAVLFDDAKGQRWGTSGLRLVADAQWKVKDYEGAKESWEVVRTADPDDLAANLALANIYERLYRQDKNLLSLKASDQAIDRVRGIDGLSHADRAEALALRGRNMKTRWRLQCNDEDALADRRVDAMNRQLIESYEAYREAYLQDLNAYYPGLAALQMGMILRDFTKDEDSWSDAFDTDEEADRYRERLRTQVDDLHVLVPNAVDTGLARMTQTDPERVWAEISDADVLFLTSDREKRVVGAYQKAIPEDNPYALDAAFGQLDLFRMLGVRAELADKVIAAIGTPPEETESETTPLRLVLMGGHTIDAPGAPARFPAASEGRVREALRTELAAVQQDGEDTIVLASAAPGADIIAHEIAVELGIPSTMCLPMPPDDYAGEVFKDLDDWRSRFLVLRGGSPEIPVLALNQQAGTARWLEQSGIDPWDRGNRWVVKLAQTWGADRVSMIVLWDREGGSTGGTSQMYQLAQKAGDIDIKVVDSTPLLEPPAPV